MLLTWAPVQVNPANAAQHRSRHGPLTACFHLPSVQNWQIDRARLVVVYRAGQGEGLVMGNEVSFWGR